MKQIFRLFLLALMMNQSLQSAEGMNPRECDKAAKALAIAFIKHQYGQEAADKFLASMAGDNIEEVTRKQTAIDIMLSHRCPALEQHLKDRAAARMSKEGLRGFPLPEKKIIRYLKEHNGEAPSTQWIDQNVWSCNTDSQQDALQIIKKHEGRTTERYLADREKAIARGEPMGRFQGPVNKVITYLKENNGKAPSKDWLSENLWPN